jgi:hypothetical protein
MIEQLLSPTARGGSIRFKDERTPFKQQIPVEVKVGHLDPVEEESGQRGRLNALGYEAGDPAKSGDGSLEFRSAVEESQCDHGLKVDGVVGAQTRKKLQDALSIFGYADPVGNDDYMPLPSIHRIFWAEVDKGGKADFQGCSEFNPV